MKMQHLFDWFRNEKFRTLLNEFRASNIADPESRKII